MEEGVRGGRRHVIAERKGDRWGGGVTGGTRGDKWS